MNEKAYEIIENKKLYRRRCNGGIYPDHLTGNNFDVYTLGNNFRHRESYFTLRGYANEAGVEDLDEFLSLIPYAAK
jgi:hypothetical protein